MATSRIIAHLFAAVAYLTIRQYNMYINVYVSSGESQRSFPRMSVS